MRPRPRPSILTALGVLAASALTTALLPASPADAGPPAGGSAPAGALARTPDKHGHGSLVLVGGALDENAQILRRIVRLADPDGSGPRHARIALVTAAAAPAESAEEAADPDQNNAAANGIYYAELFARFGAKTYAVPVDTTEDAFEGDTYGPGAADQRAVAREVRRSTGVFFGGGDQMDYVRTLQDCEPAPDEAFTECRPTRVLRAVTNVVDRGGVVAGVSAGTTIQQGADMVTGGESYEAWRDGATPGYLDDASALAYLPSGGFGLFRGAMLDSHFATWGRQARMIRLAQDTGHRRIVGIDETTALVVDRATGRAEVIGENGVSLLELTEDGASWSYLTDGDRVDVRKWRVQRAAGADDVVGAGAGPAPVSDVWDSAAAEEIGAYSLADLALALVRSAADVATGTTLETDPQFRTDLERTDSTHAWEHHGVTSFTNLRLRILAAG